MSYGPQSVEFLRPGIILLVVSVVIGTYTGWIANTYLSLKCSSVLAISAVTPFITIALLVSMEKWYVGFLTVYNSYDLIYMILGVGELGVASILSLLIKLIAKAVR
jgi:hypothetical protein